jgi:hypothetical protein
MAAGIGLGVAGVAAGMAVAGGAMAIGFVRAAEEAQQVTRQTSAVLESMGATSWITAGQVEALSTALSNRTGIDDELIQSGQNVLLTFGQVQNRVGEGNNIFDRATEAALNMSAALGTDMTQASMQIGRALNDPIRGLNALRRSGIQFTQAQEDQIRAMVEVGDVTGAQTIMLQELERQFGGSAEAQATATQRISTMWGNLQEQLGEYLLPAFEAFADWLANHLPGVLERAGEFFAPFVERIKAVVAFVQENWPIIRMVISDVLEEIKGRVSEFWGYVTGGWATFGDVLVNTSMNMGTLILDSLRANLQMFKGVFDTVMGAVQGDWDKFWGGLGNIMAGAWKAMLSTQAAMIEGMKGALVAAGRGIGGAITGALRGAWNAFADAWDRLSLTMPAIETPFGSFGGWTFDPPPAPRFHGGGTFRAPVPGGEGLAMLRDGEEVLTPGQAARGMNGQPIQVQVLLDGNVVADSLARYTNRGGVLQVRVA